MTAEILAVGTELLMGQIANTNAQYISSRLPDIGINVYFHQVVGDNPERLKGSLRHALGRSDVVIMTGGLGPTMDDLTKETVAECFGLGMVLDAESLERIRDRMSRSGNSRMARSNERQAYLPEGAIILANDNGTAPGCIIEAEEKTVVMLPGPPSEMRPMFDEKVMPYLGRHADFVLESKFLRVFGIGESKLEEMLRDIIEAQTNPTLATYAKEGEVTLRVTARYKTGHNCEAGQSCGAGASAGDCQSFNSRASSDVHVDILTPVVEEVRARIGDCLFSTEDEDLEEAALKALISKNLTLSLAESCTGGLIAARLTNIPGASGAFISSAVTYSNEAKSALLGVREETLREYGAVSRQTAREMAEGARKASGSDIALSVTGIAGPDGGSAEKPVGLVYLGISIGGGENGGGAGCSSGGGSIGGISIGVGENGGGAGCSSGGANAGKTYVREIRVLGPRARVRNIACLNAFDMIRRAALGLPWAD